MVVMLLDELKKHSSVRFHLENAIVSLRKVYQCAENLISEDMHEQSNSIVGIICIDDLYNISKSSELLGCIGIIKSTLEGILPEQE